MSTHVLRNRMLYAIASNKPQINQVRFLFSRFSFSFTKRHTFSTTPLNDPSPISPSKEPTSLSHIDLSSINFYGIAKSVLSRCPHFLEKHKEQKPLNASLKSLLLEVSDVIPHSARRFGRVLWLKPEDVLEILVGFEFESKNGIQGLKVESLWGIFKWASEQNVRFMHLPQSCEVMASLLIRVGMNREVELLLATMHTQGISMCSDGIFSDLIEGFVGAGEFERALSVYHGMMDGGFAPSLSCCRALLDSLVRMKKSQLAFQVCLDMEEMGIFLGNLEKATFDEVVSLLCSDGKIKEARSLVKKVVTLGLKPRVVVLDEVACGYCEKRDFDGLLSFFVEMEYSPSFQAGNRILNTICDVFGAQRAYMFSQELEHVGFTPNAITFGILIGWGCREGSLTSALFYLSEIFSRSLKPDIRSYNSLISGVFKIGAWKHASDILDEMMDAETKPNLSTFRVLLAGYCKFRQFAKVTSSIDEMANHGLIQLSSQEDPLSKAFTILGLSSLDVKVKRDNDLGFPRTEFFDDLGNGLYLDTDVDEFEKRISQVLEDSLLPDFDLLVMKECDHGNIETALMLVDEMVLWGQELSPSVFSELVKELCLSHFHVEAISNLHDEMPKLANKLDQDTLNLLVQAYSRKGLALRGKIVFDGMLQRHMTITNETYTALILGLCKKGNTKDLQFCWNLAQNDKWMPAFEDFRDLLESLCQRKMIEKALDLFEIMLVTFPQIRIDIFDTILEKLCSMGFTSIAHICVAEILHQTSFLDHIAYNHLIRGFCKENKFLEAFKSFDIMQGKNLFPSLDVTVPLILQLCKAGKFEKAIALKDIVLTEQASVSLLVLNALLKGFCKTGKVAEAANIFNYMLSADLLPDAEICNMLLQGQCRANNFMKARETLGVMLRKNLSLSVSSYRDLVLLMCIKDISGSLRYLNALISKDLRPHSRSLRAVVTSLCDIGEVGKALKLSQQMQSRGWIHDSSIQNAIVETLLSRGKLQEAEKFMDCMTEKCLIPDNINYDNLIKQFCRYGRLNKAVDLLNTMLKKGNVPNSTSYDSVISGFCKCNYFDQALDFHTEMIDKHLKPSINTWGVLIINLCRVGQTAEADRLLLSMVRFGETPTREMFCSVINRYCCENYIKKASELVQVMQQFGHEPDSETHWFLKSNLNYPYDNGQSTNINGFHSRFPSGSGFAR